MTGDVSLPGGRRRHVCGQTVTARGILGVMSSDKEQQRKKRSFANGNAGPEDRLQMEGWVLRPAHWWLWA